MKFKMSITDTTSKNNIKDIKSIAKSFKNIDCIDFRLRPRSTVVELEIVADDFESFLDICAKLTLHESKISNAILKGILFILKEDKIPDKYSFENFDVKLSVTGRDDARGWIFFTIDATVVSISNKSRHIQGFKVPRCKVEAKGSIRYDYDEKKFIVENDDLAEFISPELGEYIMILFNAGALGGLQSCIIIEKDGKQYLVGIRHRKPDNGIRVIIK